MRNPYETLNVGSDASAEEIKDAYKQAARDAHPDKGGSDEAMASVAEAWAILRSAGGRAHYDATGEVLGRKPPTPPEEILFLKVLVAALSRTDEVGDVITTVKRDLTATLKDAQKDYKNGQKSLAVFAEQLGRFEHVGEGENLIESTLRAAVKQHGEALEWVSEQIESHKKAIDLVYSYRDTRPPVTGFEGVDYGTIPPVWTCRPSPRSSRSFSER